MCLSVPEGDPHFELRYNALFLVGFQPNRVFRVVPTEVPFLVSSKRQRCSVALLCS
jgi:hypothetical protein